jgi:hypothetical protein
MVELARTAERSLLRLIEQVLRLGEAVPAERLPEVLAVLETDLLGELPSRRRRARQNVALAVDYEGDVRKRDESPQRRIGVDLGVDWPDIRPAVRIVLQRIPPRGPAAPGCSRIHRVASFQKL